MVGGGVGVVVQVLAELRLGVGQLDAVLRALRPAMEGTTVERSSSMYSEKVGSFSSAVSASSHMPCSLA
jgi:hypothetical protein